MGMAQQAVQWRQGTGSHGSEQGQGCGLYSLRMNGHMAQAHLPCRLTQEGAFALIGLNQMDGPRYTGRQNQPRQASPTAQISHRPFALRQQRYQLQAILNMPRPPCLWRRRANKVDPRIPPPQQRQISIKPHLCFT